MNFAINYSPQSAELLIQGQIEIDYFKCPDWQWMVAEAQKLRPVAVHFTLTAGDGKIEQTNWEMVDQLLETTGTPFINLHLESRRKDFPGIPLDTTDPDHRSLVYQRMLDDILPVAQRYGPRRVIIENVPYRGGLGKILRPSVEPELIRRLLAETGCGLLLDISHARIASYYMGMDAHEYIRQLPVKQVRELHFTGMKWIDQKLTDHLEASPADWQALETVLGNLQRKEWSQPWMLAFEYGGIGEAFEWRSDPQVIAEQAPRLYSLCHSLG
jgi:uncharacterized protein (UPF0276 family)